VAATTPEAGAAEGEIISADGGATTAQPATAVAAAPAEAGEHAAPIDAPASIVPIAEGDTAAPTAPAPEAAEEMWEDIWRPRRRGRELEQGPVRAQGSRRRPAEPAPVRPAEVRKDRPDQRKRRRDKRKERHEERPRLHLEASPPGAKTGGFDPNSPFAALYSLKAAMDKRTQD
jgi:hypothetical protein